MMKRMVIFVGALGLFASAVSETRAATWDGQADTSWVNALNWVGNVAPVPGDPILFDNNSTANLSTSLGADFSISGLTILNPAGAVAVANNTLTVGAGGIDLSAATQNLTVNSALSLGAVQTWTVANGRTLAVGGTVNNGGNLLTVTGAGAVAVSGAISGAGGLTYHGPGTLTLSGNNAAFSGPVTVTAGTAVAAAASALGSGTIAVSGAGRLQLNAAAYAPAAGTMTLTSGGTLYANFANVDQTILDTINGGASTFGYLLLQSASANNLDFTSHPGVFLGTTSLNTTYTGTLTPSGGAYRFGGGGVGYFFSGNNGLVLNNLAGANDVFVSGAGLITLAAGNTYSGRTIVSNRAAVRVDGNYFGTAPGALVADNLVLDDGVIRFGSATWTLDATRGLYLGPGGGEFHPWSTANITIAGPLSGPGGWSRTDSGNMIFTGASTFTGPVSNNVGGTVTFSGAGSLGLPSSIYQAGGTFTISAANPGAAPSGFVITNATVNLDATQAIGGGALDLRAGGVLNVNAINAMGTATATVGAGTRLQINNIAYLPGAGSVLVLNRGNYVANYANAGAETLATVDPNSTGALVLGGATSANLDMTGRPGLFLGANGDYTYGGTLTPAGTAYLLGGGANSPAVSSHTFLNFNNLSGARDVVIGQPGTVTLSAGNTFSGKIVITNGGWLTINSDTFAPVPGALVADYFTVDGGKVRPRDANFTLHANRGIYLGAGGAEFHVWGGYTTTVDGPVSGPGSILMTDGGTLRLTAVNTFSGGITMNSGTVYVNADSGLGAAGSPITLNGGGIRAANSLSLGGRAVTLAGNGTLNADAGATLTAPTAITGGGALTKEGAGTLLLGANNTYNGNTTVNNGTVRIGAAGAIPSGAGKGNVFMNPGTVLNLDGYSPTINGLTLKFGRITNTSAGASTLTVGANNQTGLISGVISGDIALTKTGSANVIINLGQAYTGLTTVAQGRLTLDGASLAGPVHVATGATLATADPTNGLRGEYYSIGTAVNLTNFASLAALDAHLAGRMPGAIQNSSSVGPNFDFGSGGAGFAPPFNSADYFDVRWTGKYNAPVSGTYTFGTASDDSSMIFIDGAVVVSNNYLQGYNGSYRQNTVYLTAGLHDIAVSFYEAGGGQGFGVSNAIPAGPLLPLTNALLLTASDLSIGSLSGASNSTVAIGNLTRMTIHQAYDTVFDGLFTGGTGAVVIVAGPETLTLTRQNQQYAGSMIVSGGALSVRNLDVAGPGGITMNGGALVFDTAGLAEGAVAGNFNLTTPNPSTNITFSTVKANQTGGWSDNTTYIYSGQIVNPGPTNVTWTFAENFDDSVLLKIDGVTLLNNGTWNAPTLNTVTLEPGAHTFEARFGQGGGGAGPVNSSWWTTTAMGFAYDPQGRNQTVIGNYVIPTDPGDGSMFTHDFRITNDVVLGTTTVLDAPVEHGSGTLGGTLSGGGGVVKAGPGTVALGGVSTYGGATVVGDGTLRAASSTAFPAATDITVSNGATLDVAAQAASAQSLTLLAGARLVGDGGSISLGSAGTAVAMQGGVTSLAATVRLTSGAGGGVVLAGGTGASVLAGVDLGAIDRTFDVGDVNATGEDLSVGGAISGAGGLRKTGAGTMVLDWVNTYAGDTVVDAGVLRLGALAPVAGSAFWLDAADASTVVTSGTSVTQWSDKSGHGRHMTQGTAANQPVYTSNPLVQEAVIHFDGANDYLGGDFSFLHNRPYTMLILEGRQDGGNRYHLSTLGSTANNALHVGYRDSDTYTFAQWANDMDYDLAPFAGQVFRTWAGELDAAGHHLFLNGANVVNNANTQPLTVTSTTSARVGAGPNGANFYFGDLAEILIYEAGLDATDRQAVETYLAYKWFGTGVILPFTTDARVAFGATLDLAGHDQVLASLADSGIGGGLVINSGLEPITLTLNPAAGSTTFSGTIDDDGPANAIALVKSGVGTQVLSGNNTFSGGTTIAAGTLQLAGGSALPDDGPVFLANVPGALLRLDSSETIGSLAGGGAAGGDVDLQANILTVGDTNDTTYAGILSGAGGGLTKAGAGTLTLTGASSYTGLTDVRGGTLRVNGSLGGGGAVTVSNATLDGSGAIAGPVVLQDGGALAPGAGLGSLAIGGGVTMELGSFFDVEVDGAAADQAAVAGAVDLGPGRATLNVTQLANAPSATSYHILTANGITGYFAGLGESSPVMIGSTMYFIHYRATYVELNLSPTEVVLHQFGAIAEGAGVVVRWRTASEVRTAGFDVYRKVNGEWVKVNDAMIAATGAPLGGIGASYALTDAGAAAGGTYEYKLVETELDGTRNEHGPYERTATAFELTSPIRATAEGMEIRWLSREGELYRVLRTTDLRNPEPEVIGRGVAATPPENVFLDTNAAPLRVYRVELE